MSMSVGKVGPCSLSISLEQQSRQAASQRKESVVTSRCMGGIGRQAAAPLNSSTRADAPLARPSQASEVARDCACGRLCRHQAGEASSWHRRQEVRSESAKPPVVELHTSCVPNATEIRPGNEACWQLVPRP